MNSLKSKFAFLVLIVLLVSCKEQSSNEDPKEKTVEDIEEQVEAPKVVNKHKLPTVNIKENDKITSPVTVEVNSQGVWFANEGSLGFVELMDDKGAQIAKGFLTTEEDWMTNLPVVFSTELTFDAKSSSKGILVIHNDPGEGDGDEAGEEISFEIPVILGN